MGKAFEPKDVIYEDFFENASSSHVIPTLQRPYSWEKKEITKLWNDIIENPSPYFIGTVVMIANKGTVSRDEVIDGQQRLTTLSLFFLVLRDYIKEKDGFKDISEEILDFLSKPRHNKKPIVRLEFSNEPSNSIFKVLVEGEKLPEEKTDTQNRFINNYDIIKDLLFLYSPNCEVVQIRTLFEKLKKVEIIFIRCLDKSSAYKLFESINATALSLAGVDLLKNSVFRLLSDDSETLQSAEVKWGELEDKFAQNASIFKTFIRHHWISEGEYTSHGSLFEKFELKYIKNKKKEEVQIYIDSLLTSADVYLSFRQARVDDLKEVDRVRFNKKEIKETLEFLNYLNVDQVYSVLLHIYNTTPASFKKDLIKLTAFQFLFKYIPGSPSKVENYFASFCSNKLSKEKMYEALEKMCIKQEESFTEAFLSKTKYVKGRSGDIQFIIERYLYSMGPSESFSKPTIEHIISQSPSKLTLKKFESDKKIFNTYKHLIGNLTVLEMRNNSSESVSNKDFVDKKEEYESSLFEGNKKILQYSFEDKPIKAIGRRGEDMVNDIFRVFFRAFQTGQWNKQINNPKVKSLIKY